MENVNPSFDERMNYAKSIQQNFAQFKSEIWQEYINGYSSIVLEIKNPNNSNDMTIYFDKDEVTLYFADFHQHIEYDDDYITKIISDLIYGKSCIYWIMDGEKAIMSGNLIFNQINSSANENIIKALEERNSHQPENYNIYTLLSKDNVYMEVYSWDNTYNKNIYMNNSKELNITERIENNG